MNNELEKIECCPKFEPANWDGKEEVWADKRFIKGRVLSFLHIPLNFGGVCTRLSAIATSAGKLDRELPWLCDENSLWGSDLYVGVTGEVPGAQNVSLSGKFVFKVFEGAYNKMPVWIKEFETWLKSTGKKSQKIYVWYTTCPKCAKKYGKNYVVMVARCE